MLVDAYKLFLNNKGTNPLGQHLVPLEALRIKMQKIRERDVLNIRQSNGYLLDIQLLLVAGRAEIRAGL